MSGKYWFRQKTYGLGAVPVTWQGWCVIAVYVVSLMGFAWFLRQSAEFTLARLAVHLGMAGILTCVLIWVCWRKTEGGWRWNWGPKKRD